MPTRPGVADLSLPIGLDFVPELLGRRGVQVARKRLQEVAAGGLLPIRREGGRYVIHEADLPAVERYFRDNPRGTARGGAAALARAGRR